MRLFGLISQVCGIVGGVAIAISAVPASATVLTFDMGPPDLVPNGVSMSLFSGYGDYVGAQPQGLFTYGSGGGLTPNVQVLYGAGLHLGFSAPLDPAHQFGDLTNVLYRDNTTPGPQQNTQLIITLLADPGFQVCLMSFDLAVLLGENLPARAVIVKDGSNNVLYDDVMPTIYGTLPPTHTSFVFDGSDPVQHPTLCAQSLTIDVDLSAVVGTSNKVPNFGIDNIKFSQIPPGIPGPGVLATMVAGMGLLATRRRRA